MGKHELVYDFAGWGNHPRITCLTCDKAIVKQLYMSIKQWEEAQELFKKEHSQDEQENNNA